MTTTPVSQSRFLQRIQGVPTETTPVWLMRQAGRYMPEYRALRARHTLLEMIRQPELAAEVTLQPVSAFDLDAAIIFSDILPPLEGMGLELSFVKGEGPVIHNPVRTAGDIAALRVPDPHESMQGTLEAIRMVRPELDARGLPLIGFAGAPFTLACYAVEGGKSRYHENARILMLSEDALWDQLMTKLATTAGEFLLAQAEAGANVLNIFDTWVGELAPHHYEQRVLPYVRQMIDIAAGAGKPIILFGVGNGPLLEAMGSSGVDVIGVDWRIDLRIARRRLGPDLVLQGNLDPVALLAPWDVLRREIDAVLAQAKGDERFIFNLGHGVLPATPVDNVRRLIEYVHEAR
ncbi:MAG: uroporphyrinogen decarboxylase [Thermomicrobiales bacterium]|nr:uroporphyrinogen decarboxylase [Thermomicrobiales bacterium]